MSLSPPETLGLYAWQREQALTGLTYFRDQMLNRVFPAFAGIEEEANAHGAAIFEAGLAAPSSGFDDGSAVAEVAHEAAVIHYGELERVLQTSINFAAASLYHVHWETPVRQWLLGEAPMFGATSKQMKQIEEGKLDDIAKFLAAHGWAFKNAPWFGSLDELRLVANTVKHAQGASARALYARRRSLFYPFNIMGEDEFIGSFEPDGADLIVTPDDFVAYAHTVEAFWTGAPAGDES